MNTYIFVLRIGWTETVFVSRGNTIDQAMNALSNKHQEINWSGVFVEKVYRTEGGVGLAEVMEV